MKKLYTLLLLVLSSFLMGGGKIVRADVHSVGCA